MANRRDALRSYFIEVVRDLVARGVIRQRAGQSLADLVRAELRTVIGEMKADVIVVAGEIGVGLVGGLETMLRKNFDNILAAGARAVVDRLGGAAKRRGG